MSFPRYPKYKDSGVEWLGEVPEHWEVGTVRRFARMKTGHTPSRNVPEYWERCTIPWFGLTDVWQLRDGRRWYLEETAESISELGLANSAAELLPRGTVVFSRTASIGFSGIMPRPMATTQDFWNWVPRSCLCSEYLLLLFRAMQGEFGRLTMGSTHKTIYQADAAALHVCVPPVAEQREVFAFVDAQTRRIDSLIDEQQHLIELLNEKRRAVISHTVAKGLTSDALMKPSGVEWLGCVPAHWSVLPVSARYEVQLGKMLDSSRITGAHLRPYLRVFDVQWGAINTEDLPVMDFDEDDREKFALRAGDLLVNEGGSYVGRSAIWSGEIEECYYQKALHRLRPRDSSLDASRFFYYVMFFATTFGVFVAGNNQNTIDHLPAEKLRKYRFTFPPLEEQLRIADFLDTQVGAIDRLIEQNERAIDLLQERRTALISAAVTGKIDVRGLVDAA